MRLVILFSQTRGLSKETNRAFFDGDAATIGRGTDQVMTIADRRIPLHHSRITLVDGKLWIKTESSFSFSVNGEPTKRSALAVGDEVVLLGHRIKVLPSESDADYTLEVELQTARLERLRDRFKTRLWQVDFPIRKLSWSLLTVTISLALLIPASGFWFGMADLRSMPIVPDDRVWLAGALHEQHALLEDDCGSCHRQPFEPIANNACTACHADSIHHFDTSMVASRFADVLRCAECHKEHSGDSLIVGEQAVCTSCHKDLAATGFESTANTVTDFSDSHPPFRVSTLQFEEDEWKSVLVYMEEDDKSENSNLKFPHELHLAENGIDSPTGQVRLDCQNCHSTEVNGLLMKPVTMEEHCAACHQLSFDPSTPERVVPHGSPAELMKTLREYYAYQYLGLDEAEKTQSEVQPLVMKFREVRRPGTRTQLITEFGVATSEAGKADVTNEARAFVTDRVNEAAKNLFERQTCTVCHTVTKMNHSEIPFRVEPVRLTQTWYPLSRFSHESHDNVTCGTCHGAAESTSAKDILMPDIDTCQTCHGGEKSRARLRSTCTTCHEYHRTASESMLSQP